MVQYEHTDNFFSICIFYSHSRSLSLVKLNRYDHTTFSLKRGFFWVEKYVPALVPGKFAQNSSSMFHMELLLSAKSPS